MKYIFNLISFLSFFSLFSTSFLTIDNFNHNGRNPNIVVSSYDIFLFRIPENSYTHIKEEAENTINLIDEKEEIDFDPCEMNIYQEKQEKEVFSTFSNILKKNYPEVLNTVDTLPCYKNYFQKRKQEFINMGNFLDQKKDNNNANDRKYILWFIKIAIEKLKAQKTLAQFYDNSVREKRKITQYFDESKLIDQMGNIITRPMNPDTEAKDYQVLLAFFDICDDDIQEKLFNKLEEKEIMNNNGKIKLTRKQILLCFLICNIIVSEENSTQHIIFYI